MSSPNQDNILDILIAHAVGAHPEEQLAYSELDSGELDPRELESFERAAAACAVAMLPREPMPAMLRERCSQAMLRSMQGESGAMDVDNGRGEPVRHDPQHREPHQLESAQIQEPKPEAPPRPIRFTPPESSSRVDAGRSRGWLVAALIAIIAAIGWWRPSPTGVQPTLLDAREALVLQGADVAEWSAWGEDESLAGVTGSVVWDGARQEGYMTFQGLEPNDPATTRYQLWIVDTTRGEPLAVPPIDGGVFDIAQNEGGEIIVPIRAALPVGKAAAFAITREGPEGTVVSERRPDQLVVIASLG